MLVTSNVRLARDKTNTKVAWEAVGEVWDSGAGKHVACLSMIYLNASGLRPTTLVTETASKYQNVLIKLRGTGSDLSKLLSPVNSILGCSKPLVTWLSMSAL